MENNAKNRKHREKKTFIVQFTSLKQEQILTSLCTPDINNNNINTSALVTSDDDLICKAKTVCEKYPINVRSIVVRNVDIEAL